LVTSRAAMAHPSMIYFTSKLMLEAVIYRDIITLGSEPETPCP
jgi:hypothetical protein